MPDLTDEELFQRYVMHVAPYVCEFAEDNGYVTGEGWDGINERAGFPG